MGLPAMDVEMWKTVDRYPLALVSNLGRVNSGGLPARRFTRSGMPWVVLQDSRGTWREVRVDQLVAAAFLRPVTNKDYIKHRNGYLEDCRADNLMILRKRKASRIDLLRAKQLMDDGVSLRMTKKLTGVSRKSLETAKKEERDDTQRV